jgi:adenylate cyclase
MPRWTPGPRTLLSLICAACTSIVLALHLTEERFAEREARAQDWLATNPAARRAAQHPEILFLGRDTATETLDEVLSGEVAQSRALQLIRQAYEEKTRWSREVYALIADRLIGAGAKAVIFDIRYPLPGEGDEAFRAALDRHAGRIVIGSNLLIEERFDAGGGVIPQIEPPAPTLIADAIRDPRVGFVNVRPGADGLVRDVYFRTTLHEFFDLDPIPGLPEIYSLPARALQQLGKGGLIPAGHGAHRIRFAEPFRPRSLYEIFVESFWNAPPYRGGELFRDKLVLIGAAGNQAEDRLNTPFGTVLGPDIHLSALNAALQGDFLVSLPPAANIASILAGGAAAWLLASSIRRALLRLSLLFFGAALYYFVAQLLFNSTGVLLLLLGPLAAFASSGLTWFAWEQAGDQRERARIRRTMERYLSKDLTRELIDNRETFLHSLGGVRRCITVLFSDVRGFTTMTEIADEKLLVKQLNEYFGEMVRLVHEHRGRLDKFIGDAVMAEWGGLEPLSSGPEADARNAVATAVAMRRELARLNADWKPRGLLELQFGIGLNHGEAIVGNLGSEEKMEVSAIGDAVNLASRLEGATKEYHVDLLIGEKVAPLVRGAFVVRTVDLLQVKGKTKPVEVFTVLGERAAETVEPAWLAPYERGVALYRKRAFAEAAECLATAVTLAPDDWLCAEYLRRCREYLAQPPGPDWDGVHVMTKK